MTRIGLLSMTLLIPLAAPLVVDAQTDARVDSAAHRAEIDAWHAGRIERLQSENGWLSLVGLSWLEEGANHAGSAKDAAVPLPASAPARLGVFHRDGRTIRFTPAKGVTVKRGGEPFTGGVIASDASGAPDVLEFGTIRMHVLDRGERIGVRVRDSEAPARKNFTGIDRFPVTTEWRKEARWDAAEPGRTIPMPNVIGQMTKEPLAGTAVFTHDGEEHRLLATFDGDRLFFVFGDLSNRTDTYGAGRFVSTDAPRDGRVVIDFNRAYNPPCAFSAYATCPLPVRENKLKVRIEAGEKRP